MTIEAYSGSDTHFRNIPTATREMGDIPLFAYHITVAISTQLQDWYHDHYFTFNACYPEDDRDPEHPYERESKMSRMLLFSGHWSALQYLLGVRSGQFQPYSDDVYKALLQKAGITRVLEIGAEDYDTLLPDYEDLLGTHARFAQIGPGGLPQYPRIAEYLQRDTELDERFDLIVSKGVFSTGGGYKEPTDFIMAAHRLLSENPHAVAVHTAKLHATINVSRLQELGERAYRDEIFYLPPDRTFLPKAGFSCGIHSDLVMTGHFAEK